MIGTSTIKVKKSPGKCMYVGSAMLIVFLVLHLRITKGDRLIKMSSKKIVKRFLLCACIHTLIHTLRLRYSVCVCVRFPIVLQTLHLIEHSTGIWRTEVTIIISLSLLFFSLSLFLLFSLLSSSSIIRQWIALHKSSNRMKNDDDHCPQLTFLQGEGNLLHPILIYTYLRVDMKRNS